MLGDTAFGTAAAFVGSTLFTDGEAFDGSVTFTALVSFFIDIGGFWHRLGGCLQVALLQRSSLAPVSLQTLPVLAFVGGAPLVSTGRTGLTDASGFSVIASAFNGAGGSTAG